MAQNEIDMIDVAALVGLPIFAGMELGVWSFSLNVFGGFDFSQSLVSAGGSSISFALVLTILSIGWIVGTNEIDGSDYEDLEYYGIVGSLAITPAYALIPFFQNIVDSSDVIALLVWMFVAIVAVWISYTE
jgi:hypothetical protein